MADVEGDDDDDDAAYADEEEEEEEEDDDDDSTLHENVLPRTFAAKPSTSTGTVAGTDDPEKDAFRSAVQAVQPFHLCTWKTLREWSAAHDALRTSRGQGRPSITMVMNGKGPKKAADGHIVSERIPAIVPHCPMPTAKRSVAHHVLVRPVAVRTVAHSTENKLNRILLAEPNFVSCVPATFQHMRPNAITTLNTRCNFSFNVVFVFRWNLTLQALARCNNTDCCKDSDLVVDLVKKTKHKTKGKGKGKGKK